MKHAMFAEFAVFTLVCLAGCSTPQKISKAVCPSPTYEYPAQLLAMPSCQATVVRKAPCNAEFRTEDGRTFYIGSPGAAPEVERFLGTLETGKTNILPAAFMEYEKNQKTTDGQPGTARAAAITDLKIKDIGRPIVVVAKTPTQYAPDVGSPPPLGMITIKGDTTVYRGQLSQIVEGGIRVQAPFPKTPDTFKSVGVLAKDIQSIQFTDQPEPSVSDLESKK